MNEEKGLVIYIIYITIYTTIYILLSSDTFGREYFLRKFHKTRDDSFDTKNVSSASEASPGFERQTNGNCY